MRTIEDWTNFDSFIAELENHHLKQYALLTDYHTLARLDVLISQEWQNIIDSDIDVNSINMTDMVQNPIMLARIWITRAFDLASTLDKKVSKSEGRMNRFRKLKDELISFRAPITKHEEATHRKNFDYAFVTTDENNRLGYATLSVNSVSRDVIANNFIDAVKSRP